MSGWTWLWLAWVAGFVALEGAALYRNNRDGVTEGKARRTLSAHLWAWFGFKRGDGERVNGWTWARRGVAVAALVWLAVHVVGGGTWWPWEA